MKNIFTQVHVASFNASVLQHKYKISSGHEGQPEYEHLLYKG